MVGLIAVPDASAAYEYLARTPAGDIAAAALDGAELFAPSNLDSEVLAVTRRATLSGRIPAARAELLIERLVGWDVTRISSRYLARSAFRLRHNFTADDALYVLVARQLRATLVTSDGRLARAPNLGVAVHHVPVA